MNQRDDDVRKVADEVGRQLEKSKNKPLKVAVMGQTGVGKSSLINALFSTNLKTDAVRPCTKEIERVVVKGNSGHELWFYDLPGIGESEKADAGYLNTYKQMLTESDIVLWAIHADNRSISFDADALHQILGSFDETTQRLLASRIVFVLTKVDLLTPPAWILNKVGNDGVFVANPEVNYLLEQKETYCQEAFILPLKNIISSRTYNDGSFNATFTGLSYDKHFVYYKGLMDREILTRLNQQFPKHIDVFERLYDNYRVVACSSLFRFNLTLLMRVIVDRLGSEAVGRFRNFYSNDGLNIVPLSQAKKYCNMLIFEQAKGKVIFDLTKMQM